MMNPEHTTVYNNRGSAYSELHQYELASVGDDRAIDLYPQYARAYYFMANDELIAAVEQVINQQVSLKSQLVFYQWLVWIRQIAREKQ